MTGAAGPLTAAELALPATRETAAHLRDTIADRLPIEAEVTACGTTMKFQLVSPPPWRGPIYLAGPAVFHRRTQQLAAVDSVALIDPDEHAPAPVLAGVQVASDARTASSVYSKELPEIHARFEEQHSHAAFGFYAVRYLTLVLNTDSREDLYDQYWERAVRLRLVRYATVASPEFSDLSTQARAAALQLASTWPSDPADLAAAIRAAS